MGELYLVVGKGALFETCRECTHDKLQETIEGMLVEFREQDIYVFEILNRFSAFDLKKSLMLG